MPGGPRGAKLAAVPREGLVPRLRQDRRSPAGPAGAVPPHPDG